MGVKSEVVGDALVIHGGNNLRGAEVCAINLRAGAALLLCGLVAEGETTITNFIQVERGYEHVVDKLKKLGAEVEYV
ncbi:MAG: UDP-N-acetylglucosamine 1-carboxyvinyltransferase, partial [Lewinella sp.]